MRNLVLALSAIGMILIGASGAKAGDYHGGHQSRSYNSTPYGVGVIIFGGHHDRSHRAYDRRQDHHAGHKRHHGKRGHYDRHDRYDRHGHYKKHKRGHKGYRHGVLPIKKIVRKLRRHDYHDISKIVLKRDRYKVRAYDYRGRPVKLVVNAYNGRILRKRYR